MSEIGEMKRHLYEKASGTSCERIPLPVAIAHHYAATLSDESPDDTASGDDQLRRLPPLPPKTRHPSWDESPDRSANSGGPGDLRRALAQKEEAPTLADLQRLIEERWPRDRFTTWLTFGPLAVMLTVSDRSRGGYYHQSEVVSLEALYWDLIEAAKKGLI